MGKLQDRDAAMATLVAAGRTQSAAMTTVMALISVNTISAPNITSINAATAAYDAAIQVANATYRWATAGE